MAALFACEEPATWRSVYERYWDVVETKAKGKKPGKLLELEKWFQEELPTVISSRPDKHITLSELVKLMEWKLTRSEPAAHPAELASLRAELAQLHQTLSLQEFQLDGLSSLLSHFPASPVRSALVPAVTREALPPGRPVQKSAAPPAAAPTPLQKSMVSVQKSAVQKLAVQKPTPPDQKPTPPDQKPTPPDQKPTPPDQKSTEV
ncbi:putative LOC107388047-like protein, partial [Nothobranchius furzeri]